MKRLWIPLALLALAFSCGDDNSLNSSDELTLQEQGEDAAVIAAESVALDSGGLLESLEATLVGDVESAGDGAPMAGKDRVLDEAVFDSSTCVWTITRARSADHGDAGFTWNATRTLHFMDAAGGCVAQRGDSLIRALDFTRQFAGESWNPRREGQKAGGGAWALTSLHDEASGALANGTHQEDGEGVVHRVRPNGEIRDVAYAYHLAIEGTDLLLIHRDGRRVPVAGTLHVVYDAVRNGHEIHRDLTITFGEGGGSIDLGDGQVYPMNPVTGEVQL
jgi:hypothetical protein